MPDFQIADAEFARQTAILTALAATINAAAAQDGAAEIVVGGQELPPIPDGGQNTMAAAAVVLLAAHFEEYIRQQVEEYAKGVVTFYPHLEPDFLTRLIDSYWRASLGKLTRFRPRYDQAWNVGAGLLLNSILRYPIQNDVTQFVASNITEHEHNMRMDTVTELCARVGIKRLIGTMSKSAALRSFLGVSKQDLVKLELEKRLKEFYDLRNGIVHSISQNIGIGATTLVDWLQFFKVFTSAFANALASSFQDFIVEKEKNRVMLERIT